MQPPRRRSPLTSRWARVAWAALLLTIAWPGPRWCLEPGVELTEVGLEAVMEMEVTSVSKKPEKRSEAAAAVFVITQEDIRRFGATSVPEALRLVPGLQVAQVDANKWAIGSRGFASRLSRSMLVLIDGRSVYSPLFAGVYWEVQDTLIEDIDRIEVIRGPGSTLWGANAVNGVVNIITKDPADTQGSLATGGGGAEERGFTALRHGGRQRDGFAYRVYGKFFDRDASFHAGTSDYDAWWMGQAGFKAKRELDGGGTLSIQGDTYAGRPGQRTQVTTYTSPYTEILEEDADLSGGNLLGSWSRSRGESSNATLHFYYDRTDRREPHFREIRNTFDVDFLHRVGVSARQEVLWGLGYRHSRGDWSAVPTIEFLPADRADNLFTAFIQDDVTIGRNRGRLTFGSKFEHNDYSGFEYQPNVRLSLTLHPRHVVWGALSRALRTPSRLEHDLAVTVLLEPATPSFARILGDKDFRPERLRSFEIGYRIEATDRLFVSLATFYNDYADLLSLEPGTPFTETSPPPSHTVVPFFLQNRMTAKTRGAELWLEWQPAPWWRLGGSYAHLRLDLEANPDSMDSTTEASTEGSSPRGQAMLHSFLDLPGGVEINLFARHVGELPSQNVKSYENLDAVVVWHLERGPSLSLIGRNLLHPQHAEFGGGSSGGSEIQRSLYGKVTWRW